MKSKVGVGMIVKNEERDLPKCLDSIKSVADLICIIDTGSTDKTEEVARMWGRVNRTPVHYATYTGASHQENGQWLIDDFSKAKNKFVEYLDSRCDYLLWMDADDVLTNPGAVNKFVSIPNERPEIFVFEIKSGNCEWFHHRMWRTKQNIWFEGACHEYPKWGKEMLEITTNARIEHNWEPGQGQEPSVGRNLRILRRVYHEGTPEEKTSRIIFYYGSALREVGRYEEAAQVFREYLARPALFWEERMFAHLYLTRALRAHGDLGGAFTAGYVALSEDQRFSEIPMEMAYMFESIGEYDKAIAHCYLALQKPPKSVLFLELNKYELEPWRVIKDCFLKKNGMKTEK
jgi:glycosyltransferase involved in cell wall biosynthesis